MLGETGRACRKRGNAGGSKLEQVRVREHAPRDVGLLQGASGAWRGFSARKEAPFQGAPANVLAEAVASWQPATRRADLRNPEFSDSIDHFYMNEKKRNATCARMEVNV
jgi:hypothetical protein